MKVGRKILFAAISGNPTALSVVITIGGRCVGHPLTVPVVITETIGVAVVIGVVVSLATLISVAIARTPLVIPVVTALLIIGGSVAIAVVVAGLVVVAVRPRRTDEHRSIFRTARTEAALGRHRA